MLINLLKKNSGDIRFIDRSWHEVQKLIDLNSSAGTANDTFGPIGGTHLGKKNMSISHRKDNRYDLSKLFFDVSHSFGESKYNKKMWIYETPPKVLETEVHESKYFEIYSDCKDSDKEVSDEDIVLDRKIVDSQKQAIM